MSGEIPARDFGISYDKLTYDPPANSRADLDPVKQSAPAAPGQEACAFPRQPHKLVNLAGIPVMILTSEASYHAGYDGCTAEFLTRAGVPNDWIKLADRGIHGNGHMMMLEKNNLQIAAVIEDWLGAKIK